MSIRKAKEVYIVSKELQVSQLELEEPIAPTTGGDGMLIHWSWFGFGVAGIGLLIIIIIVP
jgi:hypothetical protein